MDSSTLDTASVAACTRRRARTHACGASRLGEGRMTAPADARSGHEPPHGVTPPRGEDRAAGVRRPGWWQPWTALAGFAFLLHFLWEMLQVPLYAGMSEANHWAAVRRCAFATAGDMALTLFAYAIASVWARNRLWLAERSRHARRAGLVFLTTGFAVSVVLEWINVHIWLSWAYAPSTPVILGIGVNVLFQWLLLPPFALWLTRRDLSCHSSHTARNAGQ